MLCADDAFLHSEPAEHPEELNQEEEGVSSE